MINATKKFVWIPLSLLIIIFTGLTCFAVPYNGNVLEIKQPDGSKVQVKMWGDEYYQEVESIDGYTLCFDDKLKAVCYAELNKDGSELVSTGELYKGEKGLNAVSLKGRTLKKGLRVNSKSKIKKIEARKRQFKASEDTKALLPEKAAANQMVGLTILIDFKDCPANVSASEMDDLVNKTGYTGFGNNGSVRDYFYDVSCGKLTYTNKVTAYYRAKNPKSYYNDVNVPQPLRAQELITEALDYFKDKNFDFSGITLQGKYATAVNVLYAGNPDVVWAKGLWPHAASMQAPYNSGTINVSKYQMASIGSSPVIGPFCHENGHMLLNYPDLYDSGGDSKGIGMYCLMSAGCYGGAQGTNPLPPCPYLRNMVSGWGSVTAINNVSPGTILTLKSNSPDCFQYKGPDSNECFLIESIKKSGRYKSSPSEGLALWHYDKWGFSNNNQDMKPYGHYLVSLEQADGQYHMEKNVNNGDAKDLFYDTNNNSFTDTTVPNASWWDNKPSGLIISNISSPGDNMNFIYGSIITPTPAPTPTPTTDSLIIRGYVGTDFSYTDSAAEKILEGFNVEASNGKESFKVKTGTEGYFELEGLKRGTYTLKFSRNNYLERYLNINIEENIIIGSVTQPVRLYAGDIAINGVQDQVINMKDIMDIAMRFNSKDGDLKFDNEADFNQDGAINMSDVVIVSKNFNKTAKDYPQINTATPTPEPTTYRTSTPTATFIIPTATPYPSWSGKDHNYKAGDRVSYKGANYQCIKDHTSNSTWDPPSSLNILWRKIE